jgi:hypothetical protein
MRPLVLAVILLTLAATAADARRHGRHHYRYSFPRQSFEYIVPPTADYRRGEIERPSAPRGEIERRSAPRAEIERRAVERGDVLAMLPPNWRPQPPEPNERGRRYVSPDGYAWLTLYASDADQQSLDRHLKAIAFNDGEELTFLRRERDRVTVSGFKAGDTDRMFYRKVILACGERTWRHIAVEYPARMKNTVDRLITLMSRVAEDTVAEHCDDETVGRR